MNKYVILLILIAVLIGGGVMYRSFVSTRREVAPTGVVREFTVRAKKNAWRFEPGEISAQPGDRVKLTVVNEDSFDHGFAIDALGVTQRLPANSTITVEFAASQIGDFPFYCSVPCGEGLIEGVKRTHFDMIGTLHVRGTP